MKNDYVSRQAIMDSLVKEYNNRHSDGGLRLAWIELAVNRTEGIGWVPAAEATPAPDQYVLCCTRTKSGVANIVRGYHDGERWCCGMNSNVTHWMLMPEPPKED